MQEYEHGGFSEVEAGDSFMKKLNDEGVKATHFGTLDQLKSLKEKVEAKELTQDDFKAKQLDRIEALLGAIVLHFQIPYSGIITIKNQR